MSAGRDDDLPARLQEEWLKGLPTLGRETTPTRFPIRDLISALAPILAASGVLLYAILSVAYEAFYAPLGIDPAEVDLDYASILAHSVGFLLSAIGIFIGVMVLLGLLSAYWVILVSLTKTVTKRGSKFDSFLEEFARILARPLFLRRLNWRQVI